MFLPFVINNICLSENQTTYFFSSENCWSARRVFSSEAYTASNADINTNEKSKAFIVIIIITAIVSLIAFF